MSGALAIRGVSKTYDAEGAGVEALRECSFEVRAEEFVAIVGPSGCGKTTLLNAIAGFDTVSAGEIVGIKPMFRHEARHCEAEARLDHPADVRSSCYGR